MKKETNVALNVIQQACNSYFCRKCQENVRNLKKIQENDEEKADKCTSKATGQALEFGTFGNYKMSRNLCTLKI